jgi:hypothetical protein
MKLKKHESDGSDFSDQDTKPSKNKKGAARRKSKAVVDSEEEAGPAKSRVKRQVKEGDSEEDNEFKQKPEESDKKVEVKTKGKRLREASTEDKQPLDSIVVQKKKAEESDDETKPKASEAEEKAPIDDMSSELSDVIDEPPKPKRKKKEVGASASSSSKSKKPASAPTADNPDDVEMKKLQSQLTKCGIRKIWGVELKRFGEDNKAKIRHLKRLLQDAGMDGRFSEAKAREIKERRELAADLEAVTAMDQAWGAGTGRASRSRASASAGASKTKMIVESDNEKSEEEEEEKATFSRSRGRGHTDFAFLGDESESD